MARWRVGVDAGGTFTDVCLFEEETGAIRVTKVSSTPADPSRAITQGVADILAQSGAGEVVYFAHGTTVATNALIQGRGAATGLITPRRGSATCSEIGRQRRPDLYDLQPTSPDRWCGATSAWKCASGAAQAPSSAPSTRPRCVRWCADCGRVRHPRGRGLLPLQLPLPAARAEENESSVSCARSSRTPIAASRTPFCPNFASTSG